MAVKIRLRRMGSKKAPFYRVVVADSRYPRNGRFIEEIGTYDILKKPSEFNVDAEAVKKWIANGAQPTDTVKALLKKNGVIALRKGQTMKDLLAVIAKGLVDDPDSVSVEADAPNEEGTVVYHIHVAENDMGRIIGKQGRIAKAIRTIARSAAIRSEEKIMVEID